jgi:hypothetical protein
VPQALREFDIQERGVGGGIREEKSNDSKDNESHDDLSLGNIPSLMPWDDPYEAPEPGLDSKFDFEETIGCQEMTEELKRLADGLQKLGNQARKDSKDAVDYLWLSVREVADEVGRVNGQSIVLKDDVGDVTPLSELHNIDDLAEGVVEALETAITKLDTRVGYITDLMGEINEDHRVAATYALSKANEMSRRIGLLEVWGKLREVALSMIGRTLAWFNTVHCHLDAELLQLSQLHISEDECLILLSEEIIIIFSMIHDIRKQRMEFTLKGKWVEYMVRCI